MVQHGQLPSSPDLNPLALFIKEAKGSSRDGDGEDEGRSTSKSSFELDAGDLLPEQLPSIVDESAIVRYYSDSACRPIIFSDGHQGSVPSLAKLDETGNGSITYDVALALDVTTGCGGKIWPAAEVLGQYIASRRSGDQWKGKMAVELGAGTGLVGFLAAAATELSRIWITDQLPMLHLMKRNLALNDHIRETCQIAELNWGESIPEGVPKQPDVLLLADCVYLEIAFQPLVDTMKEMATADTEILFCYQQRRKADKRFFKLLKKHFSFQDVLDDDPTRRQEYNRQGTHLYQVVMRKR